MNPDHRSAKDKKLEDNARLRAWHMWHRDQLEEALAGVHHDVLERLLEQLYFRAFSGKRSFAPPAEQSEWFKRESIMLANGDDVGVVTAWQYPETWEDVSPEIIAHIMDDIERGMPDGQRYSNDNAAKKRAAWLVVQKHCPHKTQNQCRQIISTWIKQGLLYEGEYKDPVYRKRQAGLFARKPESEKEDQS